ncbi:MAG: InlB B-repeat-containing protein, partial [Oscillospiraceae bacterium]|nr:InlB B-repeat-containing protein [Oscillospiraceae bacterium]
MKRTSRKLLALLLTMLMVLSLFPTAFAESGAAKAKLEPTEALNGYIPMDYHGSRALTDAYLSGEANGTNATNPVRASLPSSYDSRSYGYITSVKNQNPYGTCWTFGTMAPIEAYMIKHGIINNDTGAAATTSMDLSELHLAWFNYTNAYDKLGMLTGDSSKPLGDTYLDQGGNGAMATFTMMRWAGPASESTSALKYSNASTSGLNSQYAYNYNIAHVTDVTWIPTANRDAVKEAIMEYGAATISYYHADTYLNSSTSAYCFKQSASYGSNNYQYGNHAVTVVGWDDNYSKSNFKSSYGPSSNGAWIIKNSWGSSWGKSGYFYLSYEDSASLNDTCFFYKVSSLDNYANCYQYDGTCNVANYQAMGNNCQIANIFTANGSESLKAVAIAPWDEATTYTLKIYKNPTTASNPTSGTLMCTQNGYFEYSGYYTIPLNTPVSLSAGDKFAVVFTLSTPSADPDDGKYVHIPYDASAKISWCQWTHANHGNTSYYKEANGSWTDVPSNGDFRIKAYTDDASYTVTAVSNNTSYGTVSVNGNKITASPKSGYYVSDAQVTSGTATVSINGNVITVNASSDCTVKVIFAVKPQYTVTYKALGATVGSNTAYIQDVITLPTTATAVNGYEFVGWTAATVAETTNKPSYYAPGASYTVTANATLNALYTRTEGSTEKIYEIVADPLSDWSGNYVITSGKDTSLIAFKGVSSDQRLENSTCGASVAYASTGMTLDGTVLKNVPANYVFTIAKNGSTYTIKSPTNYWIGTQSTYLHNMQSYQSSYSDWNIEYDTYNICMKISNVGSTQYTYLVVGSNKYFVVNTGYTTNKTQLWKETNAATIYYNTNPSTASHTHSLSYVAAVAPTCAAEGHSAYYYCAGCGKYFSDANGDNEITLASTVIAATGNHSYGAWSSNNNGTHKRVCSVCGKIETVSCTYNDVVTAPTATQQGYTTHTCTVCGYSYKDSYTPALGSDYVITFSVPAGVAAVAPVSCNSNSSVTLPTAGAPSGYSFLGWVTAPVDNASARPSGVLTGSYKPTANITLYALYSHSEGTGGETVYQLADGLENGGKYILVASGAISGTTGYAVGNTAVSSSHYLTPVAVTVNSDNTVTASSANLPKVLWVASGSSANGFSFYNEASGKYMGLDSSEYLAPTASALAWAYTANQYLDNQVDSEGYYYLSYSSSSTIRYTTSKSGAVIKLYQQTSTGTTVYTTVIGEAQHTHTPAAAVQENYVAPSCTAAGSYDEVVYCASCGEELSRTARTVAALGHSAGEPVQENYVAPTATADGGYDSVVYCTRCGAELSRTHTTLPATGETTYYTVSFSVPSGVTAPASITVEAGGSVTLPTAGAPSGYSFLGWVTSAVSNATEQPTTYTGAVTVNGDVTLYALYSYTSTSGGGETAYELLSAAPSDWTGNYLITYGTSTSSLYALKGLSGNTNYESSSAGGS